MCKQNFLTLVFSVVAIVAYAQNGVIRAEVIDDASGEAVIGANVVLHGTVTGNVTDLDGKATISNIAPGTYNVQISFISHQTQVIENVVVTEGAPTILRVRLKEESIGLDEIVVEASALRTSESSLLTVQKKSMVVLDAISSEQFSRNGDNDAASAIRRVTGVTIEGGKHLYVRGLGDRYSKTSVNGASIPGLDPNKNSVQLDIFPSNLIDNIIVFKTFSPELPGDFTGGLVDVETKDFPDYFTLQVSASIGFSPQATFNSSFLSSRKSSTDIFGFDNGMRSEPTLLTRYDASSFPQPYIDNAKLDRATKSFRNTNLNNETLSPFFNHNISFSIGNQVDIFGKKLGFIAALTHSRDSEYYDNGFTGRYSAGGAGTAFLVPEALLNDSRGMETVLLSGLLNTSLKIDDANKIKLNLLHNQSGINSSRYQEGLRARPNIDSSRVFQSRSINYTERALSSAQLEGEHVVSAFNNVKITWLSSYTRSGQEEPDVQFFANNKNFGEDGSIEYGFDAATSRRPSRYFRELEETNFDNHLDFTLPLQLWGGLDGKIRFGGAATLKDRAFRERRYEYFKTNGADNYNNDINEYLGNENLGLRENGALGVYLSNVSELRNNFDAGQSVYAGYLSAELPLLPKLRFNGGARFETTNMVVKSFDGTKGDIDKVDVLPSAAFSYEVANNMNIRASFSKTIARPTFREIAPLATFDFIGDFFQLGNPNLKRTLIKNYDLRWEAYPGTNEYLSVSAFYKDFANPIENTIVPQSGSTDGEYRFDNVAKAEVLGVELEARKSLAFISPVLSKFRAGFNVTLINSKVDISEDELRALRAFNSEAPATRSMYAQSPYIVNANLSYLNPGKKLHFNVTYNAFGKRLMYVATTIPYIYEQPRPELNISAGKNITDRLSVRVSANNLLNPEHMQSMRLNGKEYTFQSYSPGRNYSVGMRYQLE